MLLLLSIFSSILLGLLTDHVAVAETRRMLVLTSRTSSMTARKWVRAPPASGFGWVLHWTLEATEAQPRRKAQQPARRCISSSRGCSSLTCPINDVLEGYTRSTRHERLAHILAGVGVSLTLTFSAWSSCPWTPSARTPLNQSLKPPQT